MSATRITLADLERGTPSPVDYVRRLRNAQTVVRTAAAQIERLVAEARAAGKSWDTIAEGLGLSTPEAWNRYRHLDQRTHR